MFGGRKAILLGHENELVKKQVRASGILAPSQIWVLSA